MQLVVLAGGLGTRLRGSIPDGTPKPMAPVAQRPFLEHVLDMALGRGVDDIVLLVGHHGSAIADHFGPSYRGVSVRYSVEEEPLGTGGAIRHAGDLLADRFVLLNGDTYAEVDLGALVAHVSSGPLAMSLTPMADAGRFGAVAVEGPYAVDLVEKGARGPGLINAGIYGCRRDLLSYFPDRIRFSFEKDVLEPYVPVMRPKFAQTGTTFFDIGVPEDYDLADLYFSKRLHGS